MTKPRRFLGTCIAAAAASLLWALPSKGQFQPQLFVNQGSVGGAFSYQPFQIPFRMPPGSNYASIYPSGTYNYAPRFFYPSGYQPYSYIPYYSSYPRFYVPNLTPYEIPVIPGTLRVY